MGHQFYCGLGGRHVMLAIMPLAIDLCCGLGGWTKGLQLEGFDVIGFDVQRFHEYPGQLVLQDIRTLDGGRLRRAALIVASPPCEEFSRWDQPWTRSKNPPWPHVAIELFRCCERIAVEAGCPLIIENVRGAQRFVGVARAHFGKQYLWGNVPALLPVVDGQSFGRQKQSRTSSARAKRAEVPLELARFVAGLYK